jgi:hypothetical protein
LGTSLSFCSSLNFFKSLKKKPPSNTLINLTQKVIND